jgi:hypothetical protein
MFHQKTHHAILDFELLDEARMGVLENMAELIVNCLSPRGEDRPTMKEVAESLEMMRKLQLHTTNAHENNSCARKYGGSSSVDITFGETIEGTIDMSELVEDLER